MLYALGVKEGDLKEARELFQRIDIGQTGRLFHRDIVRFGDRLSSKTESSGEQLGMAAAAEASGITAEAPGCRFLS